MKKNNLIIILLILCNQYVVLAQKPQQPEIDTVSVNIATGIPLITWHHPFPDSIDGFHIKRAIFDYPGVMEGSYHTIVTINDPNQTSFEDTTTLMGIANASSRSEEYRISAYRIDGSELFLSIMCDPQHTLLMHEPNYQRCEKKTILTWNHYTLWQDSIAEYRIYFKKQNQDNYKLLQTLPATDTTWTHENLEANLIYNYYVQAIFIDSSKTTSSNPVQMYSLMDVPSDIFYANYASVNEKVIDLSFSIDTLAPMETFILLHSTDNTVFSDTLQKYNNTASPIIYHDTVDVQKRHFYKIAAKGFCHDFVGYTNLASNILLQAEAGGDGIKENKLTWNEYQTWETGVEEYNLYRTIDGQDTTLLTTLMSGETSYIDETETIINDRIDEKDFKGIFCYYIEASENSGNKLGTKNIARSNLACINTFGEVYIPNAFNPESRIEENRIFKPALLYAENYLMIIYNRWGNKIFETSNFEEGWNGRIGGRPAQKEGAYIYYIRYNDVNQNLVEKTGTFLLIYP